MENQYSAAVTASIAEATVIKMLPDHSIGIATVYRMVNKLEEIGAISRRNMYKVTCED